MGEMFRRDHALYAGFTAYLVDLLLVDINMFIPCNLTSSGEYICHSIGALPIVTGCALCGYPLVLQDWLFLILSQFLVVPISIFALNKIRNQPMPIGKIVHL